MSNIFSVEFLFLKTIKSSEIKIPFSKIVLLLKGINCLVISDLSINSASSELSLLKIKKSFSF